MRSSDSTIVRMAKAQLCALCISPDAVSLCSDANMTAQQNTNTEYIATHMEDSSDKDDVGSYHQYVLRKFCILFPDSLISTNFVQ